MINCNHEPPNNGPKCSIAAVLILLLAMILGFTIGVNIKLKFPGANTDYVGTVTGGETREIVIYRSIDGAVSGNVCKIKKQFQALVSSCFYSIGCDSSDPKDMSEFSCQNGRHYRLIWREIYDEPTGFSLTIQHPFFPRMHEKFPQRLSKRRWHIEGMACGELAKCGIDVSRMLVVGGEPYNVYSYSHVSRRNSYPSYCFDPLAFASEVQYRAKLANCDANIYDREGSHSRLQLKCERKSEPCPKALRGEISVEGLQQFSVYYSGYAVERCPNGDFMGPRDELDFGPGVPDFIERIAHDCGQVNDLPRAQRPDFR